MVWNETPKKIKEKVVAVPGEDENGEGGENGNAEGDAAENNDEGEGQKENEEGEGEKSEAEGEGN